MTTATKTRNPHAWFFIYTRSLEGYKKEYEKIIRVGIVLEYSDGKTDSLKEMYALYPRHYVGMKRTLQFEQLSELDKARKRIIAVLFSYLRFQGYAPDMDYVKETARRASKAENFNAIPLKKLKQLYRIFGEMYKDKTTKWSEETLNLIAAQII